MPQNSPAGIVPHHFFVQLLQVIPRHSHQGEFCDPGRNNALCLSEVPQALEWVDAYNLSSKVPFIATLWPCTLPRKTCSLQVEEGKSAYWSFSLITIDIFLHSFFESLRYLIVGIKKKGSLDKIQHLEMRCGCNDSYVILFLTSFAPSDMAPMCKRCTLINSHHNPMTIKSRVKSSIINSLFPFRDTWGATAVTKFTASPGKIVRVCRADWWSRAQTTIRGATSSNRSHFELNWNVGISHRRGAPVIE